MMIREGVQPLTPARWPPLQCKQAPGLACMQQVKLDLVWICASEFKPGQVPGGRVLLGSSRVRPHGYFCNPMRVGLVRMGFVNVPAAAWPSPFQHRTAAHLEGSRNWPMIGRGGTSVVYKTVYYCGVGEHNLVTRPQHKSAH